MIETRNEWLAARLNYSRLGMRLTDDAYNRE